MRLFLFVSLLPLAIFGGTISRKVDGVECKLDEGFEAITCGIRLANLQKVLDKWENLGNLDGIKEACENVAQCLTYLQCVDEENRDLTRILSNHCTTMIFLTERFGDCYEKIEKTNTTCFNSWDPFPGLDETGDVYTPPDNKVYCENFFGSKNCIKQEIFDKCDNTLWKDLKASLLLNEKICDFKDL
ncbi:unnamed protein product [Caenorhabditis angaria]|uniref:T20D4.11-like domain-containing protein n=1 Tax=Caenorhabditis angaria TaxID=860376 RepID=A0A9P1N9F3_9PELO|nr:unnamed protein product [Caenorhabditis angaria]